MERLSDNRLAHLAALTDKVIPGPWTLNETGDNYRSFCFTVTRPSEKNPPKMVHARICTVHESSLIPYNAAKQTALFLDALTPNTIKSLIVELQERRESDIVDDGPPINAPTWDGITQPKPGDVFTI
jgi:hypothetical protein